MKTFEQLNKDIKQATTMKEYGFKCSHELERLLLKRDNLKRKEEKK